MLAFGSPWPLLMKLAMGSPGLLPAGSESFVVAGAADAALALLQDRQLLTQPLLLQLFALLKAQGRPGVGLALALFMGPARQGHRTAQAQGQQERKTAIHRVWNEALTVSAPLMSRLCLRQQQV